MYPAAFNRSTTLQLPARASAGILTSALVAGCCATLPQDRSVALGKDVGRYGQQSIARNANSKGILPGTMPSSEYPNHFVACRASYDNEQGHVDDLVNEAVASGKDIVLYFHGGLSSQEYLVEELGHDLMKRVFTKPGVREEIYPIFMNYDAGPLDWDASSLRWEPLASITERLFRQPAYLDLVSDIEGRLQAPEMMDQYGEAVDYTSAAAARNIARFAGRSSTEIQFKSVDEMSEEEVRYYIDILDAERLPDEFRGKSAEKSGLNSLAVKFGEAVRSGQAEAMDTRKGARKRLDLEISSLKLRVLRIFARYVLQVDHGLVATVQEELLDAVDDAVTPSLGLGKAHWDKVKLHAHQCFQEGSNGRRIVSKLVDHRNRTGTAVHTLSHSAGSIPTAELIQLLGKTGMGQLDRIVMVVPAINQEAFSELVVPNRAVYQTLDAYVLREEFERDDDVLHELLYSSSLLYAVSSLAERGRFMDKMLLIDQHMKPSRPAYKYGSYRCVVCESPEEIWRFFEEDDGQSMVRYPFGVEEITDGAASHENTKYPWVSRDLARRILSDFGVSNSDELVFE